MKKSNFGIISIFVGAILFIISLFYILPIPEYYIISLFGLLIAVILIAIGFAYMRADEEING